jgi:hypothetical protein
LCAWAEKKGACSTFAENRASIQEQLEGLPVMEGMVDYHAAVAVVLGHGCNKLAGGCNYADKMRGKLYEQKVSVP